MCVWYIGVDVRLAENWLASFSHVTKHWPCTSTDILGKTGPAMMLCICTNTTHHCLLILRIFPPNWGVFVKLNVNRNSFRWNALPFIARGVYLNRGRPYCLQDISQVRHSSSFTHSPNNINSSTLCLHLPGCQASFLYRRPTPPPKSETAAVPDSQSYWCGWHSQGSPAVCTSHTYYVHECTN